MYDKITGPAAEEMEPFTFLTFSPSGMSYQVRNKINFI